MNTVVSDRPCPVVALPTARAPARPVAAPVRDLRLDFFRGWLQLSIFVAHIPDNIASWLLHRNVGFSNASELFVLSSGFTLGSVFALKVIRYSTRAALLDFLTRLLTLYKQHLRLSLAVLVLVAGMSWAFAGHETLATEGASEFLSRPISAFAHFITLTYQPTFLDILPLFLVLTPLVAVTALPPLGRRIVLVASLALYAGVQVFGVELTTWPDRLPWTFNPLAWQLLFLIGVSAGSATIETGSALPRHRLIGWVALAFVLFAALVRFPEFLRDSVGLHVSAPFYDVLRPYLEGRELTPLVLLHALALSVVATRLIDREARFFRTRFALAVARCGAQSLEVFSLGVLLSISAASLLEHVGATPLAQITVSLLGVLALVAFASLRDAGKEPRTHRSTIPSRTPSLEIES